MYPLRLTRSKPTQEAHRWLTPIYHCSPTPLFHRYSLEQLPRSQPALPVLGCTHIDEGGYECADPAVIQFLPDGDEAACSKHLRLKQLKAALEEVGRG